eukprot:SAG31_NODE_44319_length_263_cov_0.743902_1_plen_69_part_01
MARAARGARRAHGGAQNPFPSGTIGGHYRVDGVSVLRSLYSEVPMRTYGQSGSMPLEKQPHQSSGRTNS